MIEVLGPAPPTLEETDELSRPPLLCCSGSKPKLSKPLTSCNSSEYPINLNLINPQEFTFPHAPNLHHHHRANTKHAENIRNLVRGPYGTCVVGKCF